MEGIFLNKKDNLVRLFRFFEDSRVLGASVSLSDFDCLKENLSWFNQGKSNHKLWKGTYTLEKENIAGLLTHYFVLFELSSDQDSIFYSGYIINSEKMKLTLPSKSNESNSIGANKNDYDQLVFSRFHPELEKTKNDAHYQGYLGLMIKFDPEKLLNEFSEQFVIENGKDKFAKISEIVKSSQEIKGYINQLNYNVRKPTTEELQNLMNSHKYFRWAKEETICLGALATIFIWSRNGNEEEKNEIVAKVMANLIDSCSKLKYNQLDNFFHRYYRRLKLVFDSN